ncbi:MAG: RsmD family RNA methyltransferase [Candidatus ainarchaeum sp.]|nr:RsmD family RNA methyltransferase [Candidatus ainarchaeum sp.]
MRQRMAPGKIIYLDKEVVETLRKGTSTISFDFGRTFRKASLSDLEGIPLEGIKGDFLYAWDGRELFKLAAFDEHLYRLRMLAGKPILEIDGLRMHLVNEFKDVFDYSREVCRLLQIGKGDTVLDTCTGLGYTAIAASRLAKRVTTIEKSRAALTLAEWNPWSMELFHSNNITMIRGDSYEEVPRLKGKFTKIIHDPPRFSRAGNLYSAEFYRRLASVSAEGALLFHYFGSLGMGRRGVSVEIRRRLAKSGWEVINANRLLQGCLARKV